MESNGGEVNQCGRPQTGGGDFGHKQDVQKRKIFTSEKQNLLHFEDTPVHRRPRIVLRAKLKIKRKIFRMFTRDTIGTRMSVNGGGGGVFRTDEVGQRRRGVQKASFWSDVFDG